MEEQTISAEEIQQHYSACLDSVFVINDAIADPNKYAGDDTIIERNVAHLELMRAKEFWTTEDMGPIDAAIAAGNTSTKG